MESARLIAVDRVKACALIAVVVTHAGPARWSPAWTWIDDAVRVGFPAFHVPAFLLMAGFLYRPEGPMSASEVRRRITRVLVPYLVVLGCLYATRLAPWPGLHRLPFAVATGESYGIFYFIPVLIACVAFGWVLSRLTTPAIMALNVALLIYAIAASAWGSEARWPSFWEIRDPLGRFFYLGYFTLGWLGVPPRLARRCGRGTLLFAAISVLVLWAVWGSPPYWPLRVPLRLLYTLAIVGLLWRAEWSFPGMRFLSEASLGLYLLHRPIMDVCAPFLDPQASLLRIVGFTAVGLAGAALLCAITRVVLGRKAARRWLGA